MRRRGFAPFPTATAVVTGAASGIGLLEVQRLRAAGTRVVGGDRDPAVATMLADDPGYVGLVGDVTDPACAGALVALAEERFGPVDLLFHSAGIMPGGGIAEVDADDVLRVMAVNYAGTVHLVKAVLPGMHAHGRGRIVVMGSLTGYVPTTRFAAYSASKAAVNSFVETLAHEEAPRGVQVLLVAPTAVKTPLLRQATGGPRFVTDLADKDGSPLMITPARVLDAVERALRRERTVVLPGGVLEHAARRISPGLTWRLVRILAR